jgi:hypothetical protein
MITDEFSQGGSAALVTSAYAGLHRAAVPLRGRARKS